MAEPTAVERLRRAFNRLDRALDRTSLRQVVRVERETGEPAAPVTARVAFRSCHQLARTLDRGARLRLVAAPPEAITADGTSRIWDFAFHLPRRRARLACRWELPFEARADDFGPARIEAVATPFPAPGTPLLTMVEQGKLLYRQLHALWLDERRRGRDLPHAFRDSDEVIAELVARGLDAAAEEWSLGTRADPTGAVAWVAATRRATWETPFTG